MKIYIRYGHNSNVPLFEEIKEYLSKDAEGNLKHEVWIDLSDIYALSYEQCVGANIERNASSELLMRLKEYRFMTDSKIKRIGHLDPFEKCFG